MISSRLGSVRSATVPENVAMCQLSLGLDFYRDDYPS